MTGVSYYELSNNFAASKANHWLFTNSQMYYAWFQLKINVSRGTFFVTNNIFSASIQILCQINPYSLPFFLPPPPFLRHKLPSPIIYTNYLTIKSLMFHHPMQQIYWPWNFPNFSIINEIGELGQTIPKHSVHYFILLGYITLSSN